MRDATVAPKIASSMFPLSAKVVEPAPTHKPNMSRRRIENVPMQRKKSAASEDFEDTDIDDDTLVKATCGDPEFEHIDSFADPTDAITRNNTAKNKSMKGDGRAKAPTTITQDDDDAAPVQLPNGRWLCNHRCKDKEVCKHYCCKHGMDRPSKKAALRRVPTVGHQDQPPFKESGQRDNKTQTTLQLHALKRKSSTAVEELDLTQQVKKRETEYVISGPRDYRELHSLHTNVEKKSMPSSLHSLMYKKSSYCYGKGGEHQLSFLSQQAATRPKTSSEYGDLELDEFATEPFAVHNEPIHSEESTSLHFSEKAPVASRSSEIFGDDDSMFGEAIVGLADSQELQATNTMGTSSMQDHEGQDAIDIADEFADVDFSVDTDFAADEEVNSDMPNQMPSATARQGRRSKQTEIKTPFLEATSSPEQSRYCKPAKSMLQDREIGELQQGKVEPLQHTQPSEEDAEDEDVYSDLLNLFDIPPATDKENITTTKASVTYTSPAQPSKIKEKGAKQVAEGFQDLQPWLFQEFGDIVELVDE